MVLKTFCIIKIYFKKWNAQQFPNAMRVNLGCFSQVILGNRGRCFNFQSQNNHFIFNLPGGGAILPTSLILISELRPDRVKE